MGQACYYAYDSFGLAPRRPHYTDRRIMVCNCILEQQRGNGMGFTALSAPAGSCELVVFKEFSELFLVVIGFETQYPLKKILRVST